MQVRKIVQRAAAAIGYEAFPKYMESSRPMAKRLRILFAQFDIRSIIDIGANKGQFHDFIRFDVESSIPIHSFEPDPELVELLNRRIAKEGSQWQATRCALGAAAERRTFKRMDLNVYSSFLEPRQQAGHPRNAVLSEFEVEVKRLDDFLPELGDLSHTFIKIDTQGWDLEVLKGGPEAFRQAPLVQTELSFRPIYEGCPSWQESTQAFEAAGYIISDIFMIRSHDADDAVEGDGIFIKRPPS
jgi:FkbM family methyltransferase